MATTKAIQDILDGLSLEDLVGQVFCYDIYEKDDPEEVEEIIKKIRPGGLFFTNMSGEKIAMYTEMANKYTKVPVVIAADVENGPEAAIKGAGYLPYPMAWGACDEPALIEKAGEITAKICRKNGVHWTFAPVVDLNLNFRCPETNIRVVSDKPEHVVKMAGAYAKGIEKNGLMVAGCKHFPGQGIDERNAHFCTTVNGQTKEEWMQTYGYVYKEMIKKGAASIMVGHGSLPSYEKEIDAVYGAPPAVLSKSLMTDLLKGELGFEGCIVSDAMSMIGAAARAPLGELAVRYLKAGGDVVLFPEPTDFEHILNAVKSGEIPMERLKDAVTRFLRLKEKARLFEDQAEVEKDIGEIESLSAISQSIADKSIKIVRDYANVLPAKLKKGSKIFFLNILEPHFQKEPTGHEFDALKDEFEKNGYTVSVLTTAKHKQVQAIMNEYDLILLNVKMSSTDYHGATMRIGWNNIMVLWRAYVLQHPNFVVVSFGEPYKLYDMPYLKTYINAFSHTDESQRAAAKVIMGQIDAAGKNPVDFKPFFEREV